MTSDPVSRYQAQRMARGGRRSLLRTMSATEILDASLRVYQTLGWTFLRLTAVPTLFCVGALAFLFHYVAPLFAVTSDRSNLQTQLGEATLAVALGLFVGAPLFLIGVSYSAAVVVQLVSDYMLGNVPDARAAVASANRSLPRAAAANAWLTLLSAGGLVAGFVALVASALVDARTAEGDATAAIILLVGMFGIGIGCLVFLWVRSFFALAVPIAVLEGLPARACMRRSRQLLRAGSAASGYGAVWTLYVAVALVALMLYSGVKLSLDLLDLPTHLAQLSYSIPFPSLWMTALDLVPLFLVVWTAVPFWAAAVAMIYFERRIRTEGFDIEALAREVWLADRKSRFQL